LCIFGALGEFFGLPLTLPLAPLPQFLEEKMKKGKKQKRKPSTPKAWRQNQVCRSLFYA